MPYIKLYDQNLMPAGVINANNFSPNGGASTYYATCTNSSEETEKNVQIGNYKHTIGSILSIKFANDVPSNATINVNSKGAFNIRYKGENIPNGIIKGGDLAIFVFDGDYYCLIAIDASIDLLVSLRGKDVVYENS